MKQGICTDPAAVLAAQMLGDAIELMLMLMLILLPWQQAAPPLVMIWTPSQGDHSNTIQSENS